MILHDLRCRTCGREEEDVQVRGGIFPACRCGGERTWIPRKLSTDMGSGFFCEATWQTHSRHRDAELAMAKQARAWSEKHGIKWEPQSAGDKVGGARLESRKVNAAFGYAGQTNRRSRGEQPGEPRRQQPQRQIDPTRMGRKIGPNTRRLSRAEVNAIRRSPTWTAPIQRREH